MSDGIIRTMASWMPSVIVNLKIPTYRQVKKTITCMQKEVWHADLIKVTIWHIFSICLQTQRLQQFFKHKLNTCTHKCSSLCLGREDRWGQDFWFKSGLYIHFICYANPGTETNLFQARKKEEPHSPLITFHRIFNQPLSLNKFLISQHP